MIVFCPLKAFFSGIVCSECPRYVSCILIDYDEEIDGDGTCTDISSDEDEVFLEQSVRSRGGSQQPLEDSTDGEPQQEVTTMYMYSGTPLLLGPPSDFRGVLNVHVQYTCKL